MGHARFDTALKRRNRALAVAVVEIPGALPDHGNLRAALAEGLLSHCLLRLLFPFSPLAGRVSKWGESPQASPWRVPLTPRATARPPLPASGERGPTTQPGDVGTPHPLPHPPPTVEHSPLPS